MRDILPANDPLVSMLQCIMRSPLVDQGLKSQASEQLSRLAPSQHPKASLADIFGDIWGSM